MTSVGYELGHLIVAAVRVLAHRDRRSPEEEAVADLLGLPPEYVRNAIRHLADASILRVVRTPFEVRIEVADHTRLEELPHEEEGPAMEEEVRQFMGTKRDKQVGLEKLFRAGELDEKARSRQTDLEQKLRGFRPRTPGPNEDE